MAMPEIGRAKEKDPLAKLTPPPPVPLGNQASMYTGRSIDIPLKAVWRNPTQIRFLIRTQPKHGVLGEIRITSPNTAVVTYTHNGHDGAGLDSFTFAGQGLGTPVSAPGKVSIIISEEPSSLVVPVEVDFGTVLVGESVTKEIPLDNTGGGIVSGTVEVPPSWKIAGDGSPKYSVIHGQTNSLRLTFSPTDDRSYEEKLRFSHQHTLSVNLVGKGQAPLAFEPDGQLELTGSPVRSGTILVRNTTGQERTLSITTPEKIIGPETVKIPAGEEVPVVLKTDAKFKSGTNGMLRLESGSYKHSIPVHLFAMSPVLKVEPAERIAFGKVTAGEHYRASLKVSNDGGSDARLRIATPKFLVVTPDPATAILSPGENRTFEVSFDPQGSGNYAENISVTSGAGNPLVLAVTATINNPLASASRAPANASVPLPTPTPEGPKEAVYNDIPPIKEIRALKTTPHSVQLMWKKPAKNAVEYLIEMRSLQSVPNGPAVAKWEPWPFVSYREENGVVIADIANLQPRTINFLRVSSLDVMESASAPSPTARIVSPAAPNYHTRTILGLLIGLGAVLFFAWRYFRKRQSTRNEDAARIAKLG